MTAYELAYEPHGHSVNSLRQCWNEWMKRWLDFSVFRASNPVSDKTQTFFLKSFFKKFRRKYGFTVNEQHLLHDLCNDIRKVKRLYFSPKVCTVAREVKFFWREPSRRERC